MAVMFTTIGSSADYGNFGRWLLLLVTGICWGAQYSSMALTGESPASFSYILAVCLSNELFIVPSRWRAAMALYIISNISYGASLVFYAAVFPRLARNTPHARSLRERYENGEIPLEEYEIEESLEKNRICNISTVIRASNCSN